MRTRGSAQCDPGLVIHCTTITLSFFLFLSQSRVDTMIFFLASSNLAAPRISYSYGTLPLPQLVLPGR